MPVRLLTIREWGEEDQDDHLYPAVNDDKTVRLGRGELIEWQGRAAVTANRNSGAGWQALWKIPEKALVIITNQRVIYLTEKFDKGSTWLGFGGAAVFVAAGMTAVSKARAAHRRHGKVAVGQVRYQWPINVMLQTKQALLGAVDTALVLTCREGDLKGPLLQLRVLLPKSEGPELVETVVRHVATLRTAQAASTALTSAARANLVAQATGPTAEPGRAGARENVMFYPLEGATGVPLDA